MNKTFDCLIQGGEVFLENKIEKTDIVITNGKIIEIIKDSS
jgi:dihydroorotase-like cyclic amidohydrolase